MKILKWIGIVACIALGGLIGYWIWSLVKPKKSEIPGDQNGANDEPIGEGSKARNWGGLIGACLVLGYFVLKAVDTVNYVLFRAGKRVYEGITMEYRLAKRMAEHRRSGKKFDSYSSSGPSFQFMAREIERVRIRRFGPEYNRQHNLK